MLNIFSALTIVVCWILSIEFSKAQCAPSYSQCDGIGYQGITQCCSPATCQYSNPWYSQCLSGSTTAVLSLNQTTCSNLYGQCGGIGWTGPTMCCTGSICMYNNDYYSQCLVGTTSGTIVSTPSSLRVTSSSPTTTSMTSTTVRTTTSTRATTTTGRSTTTTGTTTSTRPTTTTGRSTTTTGTTTSTRPTTTTGITATTRTSSTTSTTSISRTTTSTRSTTSPTTTATRPIATTIGQSTTSTQSSCSSVYGQCGGINWTGATQCCAGSSCTFNNAYYSQCLPAGSSSASSTLSSSTISSSTISAGNITGLAGVTTRYWDCCKASCAWPGKASVSNPVRTCIADGVTAVDPNAQSGCNGGNAYMCSNQQPWSVNSTFSYGYAAVNVAGQTESTWCCACYALLFTSGPVAGKQMIVQATNTGSDLGNNHFDLQMPGGGVGIFNGCTSQFPGSYTWGAQYGGVSQRSDCAQLPTVLQSGCYWRFDWFMGADNPTMTFQEVTCPSALTGNTQCIRN